MMETLDDTFEVGDFVFAKLKGHPHWPATISQIETTYINGTSGHERTRYNVYFYGSHQMSMIKVESIVRFDDHYESFKKKYVNNAKFASALKELEADLDTRKNYLRSLQECSIENGQSNEHHDKPEDEMFSSLEEASDDEPILVSNDPNSVAEASSGFSESFDSDEEYIARQNQKFEIISMEAVPFPGTSEKFLVISLGFTEEDLKEDYLHIKEEIRMMNCYVRLQRLPGKAVRLYDNEQVNLTDDDEKISPWQEPPPRQEALPWQEQRRSQIKPRLFGQRKRRRSRWKSGNHESKPSITVLAAQALKRRGRVCRRRKTLYRDENRLLSLRQRHSMPSMAEFCVLDLIPEISEEPVSLFTCPICQSEFLSNDDFKQHSLNVHILGL